MACPIQVQDVKVRSLSVDFNEISWEVGGQQIDVLDFTFQVLRSEGVMGPWDAITPELEDRYLFVDNAIKSFDRYRQYNYIIRTKRKATGETWDTEPASGGDQDEDLIAREVRSHINLLMQEFIGERCWVLPVRTFGARCGCYNRDLKKPQRAGCRICWGVGYTRGYMYPIESWISIDPNGKDDTFTELGKAQANNTTARMGWFPSLKPGDLIIEGARVCRWRVVSVAASAHVGTPVHQEIQMHMIPPTSTEYAIPLVLDDDLRNLYLKPPRNFTNPQQMDVVGDEAMSDILGLYGGPKC